MRLIPKESQRVFVLTLIVGAVCGLAAVSFHLAIIKTEELLVGVALSSPHFALFGILTPTLGGLLGGALLTFVVPGARGSGIPQVKVAYQIRGGRLPFRDAAGKFFISVTDRIGRFARTRRADGANLCRNRQRAWTNVRPFATKS